MKIPIGDSTSAVIVMPKAVPLPRSSRISPIIPNARVKPIPIPRPSSAESTTEFLLANISALPRMIQFTTISGINSPRAASRDGT